MFIVTCRLGVIYVREDNDSIHCIGYDYMADMDLDIRERPLNFIRFDHLHHSHIYVEILKVYRNIQLTQESTWSNWLLPEASFGH